MKLLPRPTTYPFEGDLCTCIYLPKLCRAIESTALIGPGDIMAGLFDAAALFFNKLTYLLLTGITIVTIQYIITNEETSCWRLKLTRCHAGRQWMGILVWGLRSLSNNKVDYCICKQTSQKLGEPLQQRVRLIVCWNLQCYNNLEFAKLMNNNAILLAIKINDSCYNENIWLAQKDDD